MAGQRPKVVVFIDEDARHQGAALLRRLRHSAAVVRAETPSVFEHTLKKGVCCGYWVSQSLAGSLLPKPAMVRTLSRVVLVTHRDRAVEAALKEEGHSPRSFFWIAPEEIELLAEPTYLGSFVDESLAKASRALESHVMLLANAQIYQAVRRVLAAHPVKPLMNVTEVADSIHKSDHWLEDEWKKLQWRDPHIPALKGLLKLVVFLRFLSLRLTGTSLRECARLLGVSVRSFHRYSLEFLKRDLDELDRAELHKDVFRLVDQALGWLFPGGRFPFA